MTTSDEQRLSLARRWRLLTIGIISLCALELLALEPQPTWAFDPQLRRYPYLTDVVGSSATINWATDQSSTIGVVRWGRVGAEGCTAHTTPATRTVINVNGTNLYQWKALLNLTPDAEYCYRVYLGDNPRIDLLDSDQSPRFRTQI